jgi:hypothetical protein
VSRVPAQRTPSDHIAPPPLAPPPAPPRRRWRRILSIAAGVVALLCLTGAAVGYVLYDRATAPDRSAPDVVVDNYLRAFLVDRNDAKAGLFTCDNSDQATDLRALRRICNSRKRFNTFWRQVGQPQRSADGDVARLVDLTISAFIDGISQSDRQSWRFVTRLQDDWRVCEGVPAT